MQNSPQIIKGIARPFPVNDFRRLRSIHRLIKSDLTLMIETRLITKPMLKRLEKDAREHIGFYWSPELPQDEVRLLPELEQNDVWAVNKVVLEKISGAEEEREYNGKVRESLPELMSIYKGIVPKLVVEQLTRLSVELAFIEFLVKKIKKQLGNEIRRDLSEKDILTHIRMCGYLDKLYPTMKVYKPIYWMMGVDREKVLYNLKNISEMLKVIIKSKKLTDKHLIQIQMNKTDTEKSFGNSVDFGYRGKVWTEIIRRFMLICERKSPEINLDKMKSLVDNLYKEYSEDKTVIANSDSQ